MKKHFYALLLCSSFVISNTRAIALPFLVQPLAGVLSATAAAGAGGITVAFVGTITAVGEADEIRKSLQEDEITLSHVATAWARQLRRGKEGFKIAFSSISKALENDTKDTDEKPPVVNPSGE